jgi:hypothetical protein
MALTPDPITLRKLAVVKQLYNHGVAQASHHAVFARIIAVIAFDLASETVLRVAVGTLDAKRSVATDFPPLVQQAESLLGARSLGALPDRGNLLWVHTVRNDAQHKAKYPSETDISDARTYTRDFLNKLVQLVWGMGIDAVTLVDLINHVAIKQLLGEAEKAFASKDFLAVAERCATAMTLAVEAVQKSFVGKLPGFVGGFSLTDAFGKPSGKHDEREVLRAFEQMQETVLLIALGLNYPDYIRFRAIAGTSYFTMDGKAHPVGAKPSATETDAEFVLAYASEAIQQIEIKVGDISKPFGKDPWE